MNKAKLITVALAVAAAWMLVMATGASAKDRNHDGIPDRWEKKFDLSLKVNQANKDQDRDGVDNFNEFQEGTNPRSRDSNHNGIPDGKEDADHDGLNNHREDISGNDPVNPDTNGNGILDGNEVIGTIASFQDPTLTINLLNGGSATGQVTPSTEIKCETEHEDEVQNEASDMARTSEDGLSGDGSGGLSGSSDGGTICSTADLTPGTMVHDAELENGTFTEIELVK